MPTDVHMTADQGLVWHMGKSVTDFSKGARFYSLAIFTQVALSNLEFQHKILWRRINSERWVWPKREMLKSKCLTAGRQASKMLAPRENLIYNSRQKCRISPDSTTSCLAVELPEMPSDTAGGAVREYRKKEGRESIKGRNNSGGLDTREKKQLSGLMEINNMTFPHPQPPSRKPVGEISGIKRRKEGTKWKEEPVKQATVAPYRAKICKLPHLYISLNHLPCNDQNVKKQMALGKQTNKKTQSTKATSCVLSLWHTLIRAEKRMAY